MPLFSSALPLRVRLRKEEGKKTSSGITLHQRGAHEAEAEVGNRGEGSVTVHPRAVVRIALQLNPANEKKTDVKDVLIFVCYSRFLFPTGTQV